MRTPNAKCIVCDKPYYKPPSHITTTCCSRVCGSKHYSGKRNPNYRHGANVENKPEYNSWRAMRQRCDDPKYRAYHRYGGRGISYPEAWKEFSNFLKDMGKKPTIKHQIDRIDNDNNYSKDNCKWSTSKENNNNRANNIRTT